MRTEFRRKRSHELWSAPNPKVFFERLTTEVGYAAEPLLATCLNVNQISFAGIAGSIPLGIATDVSDIDVIAVVESSDSVVEQGGDRSRVTFRGAADSLILAECVMLVNGIEVDFQVVSHGKLSSLCERMRRGRSMFTQEELVVMGRISSAWAILGCKNQSDQSGEVSWAEALRMYCATREYYFALKEQEDARAWLKGEPSLALYLGRCAVESGCRSYLASRGFCMVGSKWLRLLSLEKGTGTDQSRGARDRMFNAVLPLLFEKSVSVGVAPEYLRSVEVFLEWTRQKVEEDPASRVALLVCPQV